MPRRAEYIPKIEAELRKSRKPISTQDIAAKLGCSNQQVHKAVSGTLRDSVQVVGRGPTGGYLYAWLERDLDDEPKKGAIIGTRHVEVGDTYSVVEIKATKAQTLVTLRNREGHQIKVSSK